MSDTNDTYQQFLAWKTTATSFNYNLPNPSIDEIFNALMFDTWKAATERATNIERERCAAVCDVECTLLGGIAAGSMVTDFGKHTHQSMAAGAKNCAASIRQGVVQYE